MTRILPDYNSERKEDGGDTIGARMEGSWVVGLWWEETRCDGVVSVWRRCFVYGEEGRVQKETKMRKTRFARRGLALVWENELQEQAHRVARRRAVQFSSLTNFCCHELLYIRNRRPAIDIFLHKQ